MNRTVRTTSVFMISLIFIMLILTDCKKSGASESFDDAVITGYDARDCVCCGGLMINFENNPVPYSGTFYLVNELPSTPVIDSNTKFPLYVKISWKFNNKVCGNTGFIDILKLEIK